eukprot:gene9953-11784_t
MTLPGGAQLPIEALRSNAITELRLNNAGLHGHVGVPVAAALSLNTSLRVLVIRGADLGGHEASGVGLGALGAAICNHASLHILDISANNLDDDDVAVLAASGVLLGPLRVLDLSGNHIGPSGASALAQALAPRPSTDTCCARSASLRELNVLGNMLGRDGASILIEVLRGSATLSALCGPLDSGSMDLSVKASIIRSGKFRLGPQPCDLLDQSRSMTIETAGDLTLIVHHLTLSRTVTSLDLTGKTSGVDGANLLAATLAVSSAEAQMTARLLNTVCVTQGVLLPVGIIRRGEVVELELRHRGLRCEDAILLAAALTASSCSLRALDLSRNEIGWKGAQALLSQTLGPMWAEGRPSAGCPLAALDLSDNPLNISHKDLSLLGPSMEAHSADAAADLSADLQSSAAARHHSAGSLQTLNLLRCGLREDVTGAILATMQRNEAHASVCGVPPRATQADFSRGGLGCPGGGLELLARELRSQACSLETLCLDENHLGTTRSHRIDPRSYLFYFRDRSPESRETLPGYSQQEIMTRLHVLGDALTENTRLTSLSACGNNLSLRHLAVLSVAHSRCLRTLILDDNELGGGTSWDNAGEGENSDESLTGEGSVEDGEECKISAALEALLTEHRTLTHLSLRRCRIDARGAASLSTGLAINAALTALLLDGEAD